MIKPVMKKENNIDSQQRQVLAEQEKEIKEEKAKIYLAKHTVTDKTQKEKIRLRLLRSVKDKDFLRNYEVCYEDGKTVGMRGTLFILICKMVI